MILVDTSVWIDHLRRGNASLADLLTQGRVVTHPLVIGELSLGNIAKRSPFLELLRALPVVQEATHEEVSIFIEQHQVWGKGIGYFDTHLLCAALLENIPLWTLDKRLDKIAAELGSSS